MKPRNATAGLLAGLLVLAGCSTLDVPRAENYAASGQQKMRSLHHWDLLAADLAERLAPHLPVGVPIHVAPAADGFAFGKGLRSLLLSRLSGRGVMLSAEPGALRLEIDTQVVRHAQPSATSAGPLKYTGLGAGLSVLRDFFRHAPASNETLTANLIGAGAIADAVTFWRDGRASGGPTGTELLVTTTLRQAGRDLARTSDLYYIERADQALYQQRQPLKNWTMVDK